MAVEVGEIRKEGWVNKESAVIRTYRKRWMVLTPDRLYSFKGESRPGPHTAPPPSSPRRCGASRGPTPPSTRHRAHASAARALRATAIRVHALGARREDPHPHPHPHPHPGERKYSDPTEEIDLRQCGTVNGD
jgi:hypothetical protein